MADTKKAVKMVKVKPIDSVDNKLLVPITADDSVINLWGVPFMVQRNDKGLPTGLVAEISEEDAAPMIECGRVAKVK